MHTTTAIVLILLFSILIDLAEAFFIIHYSILIITFIIPLCTTHTTTVTTTGSAADVSRGVGVTAVRIRYEYFRTFWDFKTFFEGYIYSSIV